jgi:hypothetical protein
VKRRWLSSGEPTSPSESESDLRTPEKKITRRITFDPPPIKRSHIPPSAFYPVKKPEELDIEEPLGHCLECGALVSPHVQLCGKSVCLNPPPTPPKQESDSEETSPKPFPKKVQVLPIIKWSRHRLLYPSTDNGVPLHDLAATMWGVDRDTAIKIYNHSTKIN